MLGELDFESGERSRSIRVLRDQLAVAREELDRELRLVSEIQRSLLPEELPVIEGVELAAYYRPCAMAGGDYYDVMPLEDPKAGRWGLVVADVAGHGTSAAVIMAVMRTLVHAHLPHTAPLPACEFLGFLNSQMTDVYVRGGRFVTLWCACLDVKARTLTYASAGHNPARIVRGGEILELDEVGGFPLGIDGAGKYGETCVPLEVGDLVVVYTDGITEAVREGTGGNGSGHREMFEVEGLDEVLRGCGGESARGCVERVMEAVERFSGEGVPTDDQTLMVIRVG